MIPSREVITNVFGSQHPVGNPKNMRPETSTAPELLKREPFPAWSALDDAKQKADSFTKEATREYEVASQKVQARTGHIEPWTAKYYATCTFGGMLACVSI